MLRRVILLLMIAVGVDIFDVHQCGAQQITMDFDTDCRSSMNRGMAGYRQCIYDNRLRQIEQMSAKTCSKQKCYFKLSFAGRIRQSMAEPENADTSYINIFKGAEFSFVDGQAFATGDAEFPYGRLLIDEKGEPTILGQCTGNGCTDLNYVRGRYRGSRMYGPFGSDYRHAVWVLELQR